MDGWDNLRTRLDGLLPPDSLRARLVKGAFWSTVGTLLANGFAFAASVMVARILAWEKYGGREAYGGFAIIRSTIVMVGTMAGLGLGLTAMKHVAQLRKNDAERAGRIIGLSTMVALISGGTFALVLFLLAPFLTEYVLKASQLTTGLRIACVYLFLEALLGAQRGVLAGLEAFRTVAKISLYRGLLVLPVMVAGVYFWGLHGAVTALVVVSAFDWGVHFFAVRRQTRKRNIQVRYRHVMQELPVLWHFALPASLGMILYGPAIWLANVMLVRQPTGLDELGLFNAANVMARVMIMVTIPVGYVLLPILSSAEGQRSRLFRRTNILVTWVIAMLIAVPVVCFPEMVGYLFGRRYAGTQFNITLLFVVWAAAIRIYTTGPGRVLAARDLMWWGFLTNAVWAVLFVGAMVFARFHGSIGMSVAYLVSWGLSALIFIPFYIRRRLVARELLWSPSVLCMWLVFIVAIVMNFFFFKFSEVSILVRILVRVIVAVCAFLTVGVLALRLLRGGDTVAVGEEE